MGALQVMPATASEMGVTNPRDPEQNVYAGAKYLSGLLDKYQTPELAVAAYNAGPQRVDDYLAGKASLPAETLAYVPKVVGAYQRATAAASAPGAAAPAPYQIASADTGIASDANPNPNAPPSATAVPTSPTPAVGDPFSAMMQAATAATGGTSGQAGASAPAAPTAAPAGQDQGSAGTVAPAAASDPFSDLMTAASKASGTAPAAAPAAGTPAPAVAASSTAVTSASAPPAAPSLLSDIGSGISNAASAVANSRLGSAVGSAARSIGAGVNQGENDVAGTLNKAASYVDQRAPFLASVDQRTGLDPTAAAPSYTADAQQFQQNYGNNSLATVARLGGNLLATAPFMAAGGAGLGAAGGALAEGAGGTATALGRGIQLGSNFLRGAATANSNPVVNTLVRAGSLSVANALAGTANSALTANASDQPLGNQLATGAETGAMLGPLAGLAGAAASKVGQVGAALVQPFYQGGRDAIVSRVLQKAADGGPITPDLTSYVPGSSPTLAQATANPGLAAVERAVQAVRPNQFDALAQANDDARAASLEAVRGDPTSLQDLIDNRSQNATQVYGTAFGGSTVPVNPQPVVDQIDSILASPAGQRDAVQSALGNIRSKLVVQSSRPIPRSSTASGSRSRTCSPQRHRARCPAPSWRLRSSAK